MPRLPVISGKEAVDTFEEAGLAGNTERREPHHFNQGRGPDRSLRS